MISNYLYGTILGNKIKYLSSNLEWTFRFKNELSSVISFTNTEDILFN